MSYKHKNTLNNNNVYEDNNDDYDIDDEEEFEEEDDNEIMDLFKKQIEAEIDNDDSEDEEKWVPEFQNCDCCKGFVYNCVGEICKSMGCCFCKMKYDIDNN